MNETLQLLHARRSVMAKNMAAPGPNKEQRDSILTAAARVPDHGKTVPFYFVVFEGGARKTIGQSLATIYQKKNPNAEQEKIEIEETRFLRAPTVIAVIHRLRKGKHPQWEQIMSTGAACQNLILAANAHGFATQWLTEWYAYDEEAREALGLDSRDTIAGFIHIGTSKEAPEDRDRPDLSKIVTNWEEGVSLNKGDTYDRDKFDYPKLGIGKN